MSAETHLLRPVRMVVQLLFLSAIPPPIINPYPFPVIYMETRLPWWMVGAMEQLLPTTITVLLVPLQRTRDVLGSATCGVLYCSLHLVDGLVQIGWGHPPLLVCFPSYFGTPVELLLNHLRCRVCGSSSVCCASRLSFIFFCVNEQPGLGGTIRPASFLVWAGCSWLLRHAVGATSVGRWWL